MVSFTSVVALFLCAALVLGFLMPVGAARADEETVPPEKTEDGIRFVQVAAGYDFGIGLTYDGKLYGWSTGSRPGIANPNTLGEYYTATPTEINVVFRRGPDGDAVFGQSAYNAIRTDDRIKSIAATAYTAAFITEQGYLYTWGKDTTDYPYHDVGHTEDPKESTHYLLLRDVDTTTYTWQVPFIIDYYYYIDGRTKSGQSGKDATPTEQLIPTGVSTTSFAAGEYNYILMFESSYPTSGNSAGWPNATGSSGKFYHTFVWGSALYNAVNSPVQDSYTYNGTNIQVTKGWGRSVFNTFISTDTANISVVAGGYTVGINTASVGTNSNSTSLLLRGKNFLTTQNVTISDETSGSVGSYKKYTVTKTTNLVPYSGSAGYRSSIDIKIANTNDIVENAIAGGGGYNLNNGYLYGLNDGESKDMYYARQAKNGGLTYSVPQDHPADYIIGNDSSRKTDDLPSTAGDGKIRTYGDNKTALMPVRYPVALGNDVGYGISGGNLYGWGDNEYSQVSANGSKGSVVQEPTRMLSGTFVSVVAGKQKTKTRQTNENTKAFWGSVSNTLSDSTSSESAFVASVQNDADYISAALTDKGTIWAWANGVPSKELYYVNKTGSQQEEFVAIYSGYSHNLYAVTSHGKLVRITVSGGDFVQNVYDEFADKNGRPITNWSLNNNNKVVFSPSAAPTANALAPDFDTATFYVWTSSLSAVTVDRGEEEEEEDETEVVSHTVFSNGSSAGYKPLINGNNIGDAYRIIGLKEGDANIPFVSKSNLTNEKYDESNELRDNYYYPRFYFDGKLMSDKQQQNMFEFSVVYDATNGVGIRIHPLQSSKGKNITLEFYVARYNDYNKYTGNSAANVADNAVYYDYEKCNITFSIADTASVIKFVTHDGNDNSNIPLLDPNNPNNTQYSIAAQDVSTGIEELIKFLLNDYSEEVKSKPEFVAFKGAIIKQMKANDVGFPDSDRIERADLRYYLNAADLAKYNDTYQYIFADRDSDRIRLAPYADVVGNNIISNNATNVEGTIGTVTVDVALSSAAANSTYSIDADAGIVKLLSTDFNNKYGLYNFKFSTKEEINYLTFSYDVVLFTAKNATGELRYTGTTANDTHVTGYVTSRQSGYANARLYGNTVTTYNYDDEKGYVETNTTVRTNANNVAYVYSQPSLRLKSDLVNGQVTDINGNVQGNKNTYVVNYSTVFVGDTIEIKLSDYIYFTNTTYVSFSYDNATTGAKLKAFSDQFIDYTGQPDMAVVSLTQSQITVHPTTDMNINFTVALQRFADAEKSRYFTYGTGYADEKIFITFNFNSIVGFNINKNTTAETTEYLITKNSTFELFGEGSDNINSSPFISLVRKDTGGSLTQDAYNALKTNAKIYDVKSSEDAKANENRLFNYNYNPSDKTKFTVTPLRSGTGVIQFSVNVYDKSVSFRLTINVSAKTTYSSITIIDDQYITVSELYEVLRNANSFNPSFNSETTGNKYHILYDDVQDNSVKNNNKVYNAIYFTNEANETGLPSFVSNAVFENIKTDPTIRIIAADSAVPSSQTYYMHVRFTNADTTVTTYEGAPDGTVIEIIIPLVSGKIYLNGENGAPLTADIDCRHTQKATNWWTTQGSALNTKVTMDLSYLLDLINTDPNDTTSYGSFKIFLLSADSSAAKYFQYDKSVDELKIEITPKANTTKYYELNVSVYNADNVADTRVLSFKISITGIIDKLPVMEEDDLIGYGNIWIYSAVIVFGVLFIIFMIRFILYMRARTKQRAIIKRNQELIRMRDRMHGKASAASREQLVKSKLKMEDPKYAKMFSEMRRDKEEESGVALVNSDLAATAEKKSKKKKKGGKKSVAELKAELEAKKAAFAAAQAGGVPPVTPFATDVPVEGAGFVPPDGGFGMDGGGFVPPDGGFGDPGAGFGDPNAGFGDPGAGFGGDGGYGAQDMDGNTIVFDASDISGGNM
ncbi:MAG: hypothetical protein J1F71_01705 [Clostridiales bacterium]|nr:hypothetical protein [Clostridiales bacterium]